MKKLLALSLVANIWFAAVIANLESFRYATQVGLCSEQRIAGEEVIRQYVSKEMYSCLSAQQPRTSHLWNFFYGVSAI